MFGPIFWKSSMVTPLILLHFLNAFDKKRGFDKKNWHILFDQNLSRATVTPIFWGSLRISFVYSETKGNTTTSWTMWGFWCKTAHSFGLSQERAPPLQLSKPGAARKGSMVRYDPEWVMHDSQALDPKQTMSSKYPERWFQACAIALFVTVPKGVLRCWLS